MATERAPKAIDTVFNREIPLRETVISTGRKILRRVGPPVALIAAGGMLGPTVNAIDHLGTTVTASRPDDAAPQATVRTDAETSKQQPVDQRQAATLDTMATKGPSTLPKQAIARVTIKPGDTEWGRATKELIREGNPDPSIPAKNAATHVINAENSQIGNPNVLKPGHKLKIPTFLRELNRIRKEKITKNTPKAIRRLARDLNQANHYPEGTSFDSHIVRKNENRMARDISRVVTEAQNPGSIRSFLKEEGITIKVADAHTSPAQPDADLVAAYQPKTPNTAAHVSTASVDTRITNSSLPQTNVDRPTVTNTANTPDATTRSSQTQLDAAFTPNLPSHLSPEAQFKTDLATAEAAGLVKKDRKLGKSPTVWGKEARQTREIKRPFTTAEDNIVTHLVMGMNPEGFNFNDMGENSKFTDLNEHGRLMAAVISHITPDQVKEMKGKIPDSTHKFLATLVELNYRSGDMSAEEIWKSDREAAAEYLKFVNALGATALSDHADQFKKILEHPYAAAYALKKFFNEPPNKASESDYSTSIPTSGVSTVVFSPTGIALAA